MPGEEVKFVVRGTKWPDAVAVLATCFILHTLNEPKVHTNHTLGSPKSAEKRGCRQGYHQ